LIKKLLSAEDLNLWNKITKELEPIEKSNTVSFGVKKKLVTEGLVRNRHLSLSTLQPLKLQKEQKPSQVIGKEIDRKKFRQIKKGKTRPEDVLDLHGYTVSQAYSHLEKFLQKAVYRDLRLILVITGKGALDVENNFKINSKGILRRSFINWLNTERLSQYIIQSLPAHRTHGGEGAFYVYLKRKSKLY
jgi:DNA-nicking Smr family endonuclease